jgi:hypothetical protein
MFGAFHNSIGVANVMEFSADMVARPRYITAARSAAGFVEAARIILDR